LQRRFKAHLRKKYVSEEETPFVKHAFLQQDWDMFVQETNSPSFQQLSQEMKQKGALNNKPHKTNRKGYRGNERTLMSPRGGRVNRRDDQIELFLP
jgi:hypothetical protein